MSIEKYIKAGIIAGIVLVGFTIVTVVVQTYSNYFSSMFIVPLDEAKAKKLFEESQEYQAFKTRFPDHKTSFWANKYEARFEAGAMNSETQNQLLLTMYYDNERKLSQNIVCDTMERKSPNRYNAEGTFVKTFLESTTCLNPKSNTK